MTSCFKLDRFGKEKGLEKATWILVGGMVVQPKKKCYRLDFFFFIFSETEVLGIMGRELEGAGENSPGSDLLRRFSPEQSCSDTGHLRESLVQHLKMSQGTCLVVQWLRPDAPNAAGLGSIPGPETRSHMPQLRVCMLPLKIPHAGTQDPAQPNK